MNPEEQENNLNNIEVSYTLSLNELMDEEFFINYTSFSSFDEMLEKSNLKEKYPDFGELTLSEEWNNFINEKTNFTSWREMEDTAVKLFLIKKSGQSTPY